MERHVFLSVLFVSLIAVFVGIFLIPARQAGEVNLPWQIEITPAGGSRVFGVEIGSSTLAETEKAFQETAEVTLFEDKEGARVVEAYFNNVDISGLRARVVLVMNLDQAQMEEMYQRGERLANMGGGRHKVTLAEADLKRLQQTTYNSLSYIPRHNLDDQLVTARFGKPAERITESNGKVVHWLYPDKGLDVAIDPDAKEVLQYVLPAQFDVVRRPLLKQSGTPKQ